MPAWPADLPYIIDLGVFRVLEITRPAKWTEFEDGPDLGRPTGAGKRAKLAYRIPWDGRVEGDKFMDFFETDCADGTARFSMPVWNPKTGLYEVRNCIFDQGKATVEPHGLGFAAVFTLVVYNWRG